MTKEEVLKRLDLLEAEIQTTTKALEQNIANLNMLRGGKSEAQFWLNQLATTEEKDNGKETSL